MSLRRLSPHQPDGFAFTPANLDWAHGQIAKYPAGRQASAVIPLLWRAQEQEGWVTKPAIETVARMLEMAEIRVLEVATFYFMFQLAPVGSVAHIQVCGTTSCMICGAEDLVAVCQAKIARAPHALSPDGRFSWEEVECLGACANAPMAQIGKDYYEDLTATKLAGLLDAFAAGEVPAPGPQNGRWASEPQAGFTALAGVADEAANASVALALRHGDTVARITGAPLGTPVDQPDQPAPVPELASAPAVHAVGEAVHADQAIGRPEAGAPAEGLADEGGGLAEAPAPVSAEAAAPVAAEGLEDGSDALAPVGAGVPASATDEGLAEGGEVPASVGAEAPEARPAPLAGPRGGVADDLKLIKGVGPKLERMLHGMGVYHFDQIAGWTPAELAWVDANLEGFKGRAVREAWVAQARALAGGN